MLFRQPAQFRIVMMSEAAGSPLPGSERPTSVSVIVPTWQRREAVLRLLDALDAQATDEVEVVIAIDGSTDGTREALEHRRDACRLRIVDGPRRGRAGACNAAIAVASGDLLVLLDDDMAPAPGFLSAHRRAHQGHERRGVMGAAPVQVDPRAAPAVRYVAAKFNGHLVQLARPDYTLRLTDFYSGNFSIRRQVLIETGGFDEDFQLYGNEDLELSYRLSRADVTFVYEPHALAHQYNDKDFAALARDALEEGRTAVLFADKHPDAFAHLKLGSYDRAPFVARVVRGALLRLSRAWPGFSNRITALEARLARLEPPGLTSFYRLALGYFFWVGARAALTERRGGESNEYLARLAAALEA